MLEFHLAVCPVYGDCARRKDQFDIIVGIPGGGFEIEPLFRELALHIGF